MRYFARTQHRALLWAGAPDDGEASSWPRGAARAASTRLLDRFVARLSWGEEQLPAPVDEVVLPDPAVHLFLDLGDHPSAVVAGPTTSPTQLHLHGDIVQVAVRLQPGATRALFGVESHVLTDRVVPLDALWGPDADALLDDVLGADAARRPDLVEHTLTARLQHGEANPDPRVGRAMALLLGDGGAPHSSAALSEALGVGQRRLEQLLRRDVGLSVTSLRRIARLRATVDTLVDEASTPLGAIAQACGFADQAHLTRELKRMAGITPGRLRDFASVQDLGPAWG